MNKYKYKLNGQTSGLPTSHLEFKKYRIIVLFITITELSTTVTLNTKPVFLSTVLLTTSKFTTRSHF
jgi:hypothetical protein